MTDPTHPDTIDWNQFWTDADDEDRDSARPARRHVVDLLPEFVEERGVPNSVADVGCGPGDLVFALADRYPETDVVGYDAAASVVAENRQRARAEDVTNATFERATLPDFDPGGEFDLVACCHTLCYVAESERALRALYDAVSPGGTLVLAYTNERAVALRERRRGPAHRRGRRPRGRPRPVRRAVQPRTRRREHALLRRRPRRARDVAAELLVRRGQAREAVDVAQPPARLGAEVATRTLRGRRDRP